MSLDQAGDPDRGVGLTVAPSSPYVLAPTKLLNDNLLGAELVHNDPNHLGTVDLGGPDGRSGRSSGDQQDLGKDNFITGFPVPPVDPNMVPLADSELVAAVFNNCIHPPTLLARTEALPIRTMPSPRAPEGLATRMNSPDGSDSLPGPLGKAAIVLARAEKKKSPASNQCWSVGDQAVLAFLAEVSMQQRFVTTIREFPLTLTWFLTWSINPLIFTLQR